MAQKPNLENDNFISKIVTDPKQVPETLMLSGYLGASSEDKHTRLYFDTNLSSYVEIPDDGILHTQDYPAGTSPFGGSYVWIKKDAVIVHGKANAERTRAKFLEGPIVNDFGNLGGFDFGHGNVFDTTIFNPPSYVGSPACGHTTNNFCTRIGCQPTEQPFCPRTTNPLQCQPPTPNCPPPTPNCPTRDSWDCPPTNGRPICPSVIAVCDTMICDLQYGNYENPKFQNVHAILATIQTPICTPTLNNSNCFTRNNPVCPTRTCNQRPSVFNPPCQAITNNPPCNIRTVVVPCITQNNHPVCNINDIRSFVGCPSLAGCPTDYGGGFDFGGNPIRY